MVRAISERPSISTLSCLITKKGIFITNEIDRHERVESERFKYYSYDELINRDKTSLDVFWLKDDSLDNLDNLPPPDILQQEIIDHLEAALLAFKDVAAGLPSSSE
jgi:type I restriction enzyme M protein